MTSGTPAATAHLTEAQLDRWRELVRTPAATLPKTLQRRVRVAIEREGLRRDAVEWAIAAYVRKVVPKTRRGDPSRWAVRDGVIPDLPRGELD